MFRPAQPSDSHDVVSLFAIAARAVNARPEDADAVSRALVLATSELVPPERVAAEECIKLWKLFVRVAKLPKPKLRYEAARALHSDLDTIGQRLDLPPMADWDKIPEVLNARNAVSLEMIVDDEAGTTIEEIRVRARDKATKNPGKGVPPLEAKVVLGMIVDMSENAREKLFREGVGAGAFGRGDTTSVKRILAKGAKLGKDDTNLAETLEKVGKWLID